MVGAWIEPAVLVLPTDCTIGDAQIRLERENGFDFHRIFVVDTDQKLQGYVSLGKLLSGSKDSPITSILEASSYVLRATASLDSAITDPGWDANDFLPVVDRRERFLGVMRYAALRTALSKPKPQTDEHDIPGTFMDLAETCYLGLADVMSSTLAGDGSSHGNRG